MMGTTKKPHGHYCRICQQYKANEKFSGRGHVAHICKVCAKRGNKPPEIEPEPPVYIDIENTDTFYSDLDSFVFTADVDDKPQKKKKRKPSKGKILRAAQKKQAKALLSDMLANGDISKTEIEEAATKAGIPTDALHRAKGSLGIRAIGTENGSVWHLPEWKRQS